MTCVAAAMLHTRALVATLVLVAVDALVIPSCEADTDSFCVGAGADL